MAASPLTFAVDSPVRRETGLREPLNLMSRWRASYFADISVLERFGSPADGALPYPDTVLYRVRGTVVMSAPPPGALAFAPQYNVAPF
jgi:hypothetical protein